MAKSDAFSFDETLQAGGAKPRAKLCAALMARTETAMGQLLAPSADEMASDEAATELAAALGVLGACAALVGAFGTGADAASAPDALPQTLAALHDGLLLTAAAPMQLQARVAGSSSEPR